MIEISKDEAMFLRESLKNVHIIRTCKSKGGARRGRRFVEESPHILATLRKFHYAPSPKEVGKR